MPKEWTGEAVKALHLNGIAQIELAEEMNCTKEYVSMILNSKREPPDIQNIVEEAISSIIRRKQEEARE